MRIDRFEKSALSIIFLCVLWCGNIIAGQENVAHTSGSLSLDDILNLPVTVASKKSLSSRESPGVVTVITESDIQSMGARDLVDVLQMVPGVAIASDVEGALGIGVRGNWAYEGKALLLIDDHEMNELNYSTFLLGNHYPVDQIKKIEIIRGPGSVIYGGYAELTVIKITTKSAEEIDGTNSSVKMGTMAHALGRFNLNLEVGKRVSDNFSYKLGVLFGKGNRSDRDFIDLYGNQFNMAGNSRVNPMFLNSEIQYKNFELSVLYDHYVTTDRAGYNIATTQSVPVNFDSLLSTAKYKVKTLNDQLEVIPVIRFDYFQPWNSVGPEADAIQSATDSNGNSLFTANAIRYNRWTERLRFEVTAAYDLTKDLNLLVGTEKALYYARDGLGTFQTTGTNELNYNTAAFYTQGMWNAGYFRMTLGARYEMNSLVGNAFVPRVVLTKILDPFHFKILASTSFRAPSVENIDTNVNIKPERTTVYEFESGYQYSKEIFFTANIFDITIKNPIIYTGSSSSYLNYDQTGSRGFELELKHVDRNHRTTLNYSFYSASGKNKVSVYEVPGREDALLGLPQQKWTLNSNNRIWYDLYFNPTVIYLGSRYGYAYSGQPSPVYTDNTSPQSALLRQFSGIWLLNTYFHYNDLGIKNLNLGLGVFNLLDQAYDYIQPYYTSGLAHAPLPSPSREWVVDLGYHYGF